MDSTRTSALLVLNCPVPHEITLCFLASLLVSPLGVGLNRDLQSRAFTRRLCRQRTMVGLFLGIPEKNHPSSDDGKQPGRFFLLFPRSPNRIQLPSHRARAHKAPLGLTRPGWGIRVIPWRGSGRMKHPRLHTIHRYARVVMVGGG